MPPGLQNAPVTHQPGHLVGRLQRERPEILLHIVVTEIVSRATFLRANEVLEFHRVDNEEHRGVVPDHIVIAFGGVEFHCETAWITPRVRAAALAATLENPISMSVVTPGWNSVALV